MALIKDQIVEAARELNRELGLEPRINTRQEIGPIKELLLEAADLITEEDDISEKTMNVIEELRMEMDQEENELEDGNDGIRYPDISAGRKKRRRGREEEKKVERAG